MITRFKQFHSFRRQAAVVARPWQAVGLVVILIAGLAIGAARTQDRLSLAALDPAAEGKLLQTLSDSPRAASHLRFIPAQVMWMEVTAYCPCTKCCGPQAAGITASGKEVDYNGGRFVAADTALLPFGTRLQVPGYHNQATVEVIDRGGAIKGNKLDLYFPSHDQALQWGRQWVPVTILDHSPMQTASAE